MIKPMLINLTRRFSVIETKVVLFAITAFYRKTHHAGDHYIVVMENGVEYDITDECYEHITSAFFR